MTPGCLVPERICLELALDAEASGENCHALNYFSAVSGDGNSIALRDEITGETWSVRPKVVVNAAGPWIDLVNDGFGKGEERFIGGTKGSHLVLDHPELLEATRGSEFYFENEDGRLVLILPFHNRVMVGTTDIRIGNPDEAVATEAEIDYLLAMVNKVFPAIRTRAFAYCFHVFGREAAALQRRRPDGPDQPRSQHSHHRAKWRAALSDSLADRRQVDDFSRFR